MEKRKFLTLPGLEIESSVVQPVASRNIDYALLAPKTLLCARKITPCHSPQYRNFNGNSPEDSKANDSWGYHNSSSETLYRRLPD
jgi:hypothetical protein